MNTPTPSRHFATRLFVVCLLAMAGGMPGVSLRADEARFFPKPGMDFGVYYYPGHCPEDQWERDIKGIAELGFDFANLAEFAWARMEPEDGRFDFVWLDRVVDLAEKMASRS